MYSTDETVCGTWIDGKLIYRKVIQTTFTVGSTDVFVADDIDIVTNAYGYSPRDAYQWFIPYAGKNSSSDSLSLSFLPSKKLRIDAGTGWTNNRNAVIIVEYTKE